MPFTDKLPVAARVVVVCLKIKDDGEHIWHIVPDKLNIDRLYATIIIDGNVVVKIMYTSDFENVESLRKTLNIIMINRSRRYKLRLGDLLKLSQARILLNSKQ